MKKNILIYIVLFSSVLSGSCDFLFGTREDIVTDEIFEEGAIDPDLVPVSYTHLTLPTSDLV